MAKGHYSTNSLDFASAPEVNRGGNSVGDAARAENPGALDQGLQFGVDSANAGSHTTTKGVFGGQPKSPFNALDLVGKGQTGNHLQANMAAMSRMSGPPQR